MVQGLTRRLISLRGGVVVGNGQREPTVFHRLVQTAHFDVEIVVPERRRVIAQRAQDADFRFTGEHVEERRALEKITTVQQKHVAMLRPKAANEMGATGRAAEPGVSGIGVGKWFQARVRVVRVKDMERAVIRISERFGEGGGSERAGSESHEASCYKMPSCDHAYLVS